MTKDIFDPVYWHRRIDDAPRGQFHHSIYKTTPGDWDMIARAHKDILVRYVGQTTKVLDAGCGWGRLISLMPKDWEGPYVGIDLCPKFIEMAKCQWLPPFQFVVMDLRDLSAFHTNEFDLAVLISIRQMVIREKGVDVWGQINEELKRVAQRRLFLEYDHREPGVLES